MKQQIFVSCQHGCNIEVIVNLKWSDGPLEMTRPRQRVASGFGVCAMCGEKTKVALNLDAARHTGDNTNRARK